MNDMTSLSKIVKEEADWLFNEVVEHVEPENFDAVYESVTADFRLGTIAMASKMQNVFEFLELQNDPNAKRVVEYLKEFITEQADELELGARYL